MNSRIFLWSASTVWMLVSSIPAKAEISDIRKMLDRLFNKKRKDLNTSC
ncbi:MAG: hypothetical protein IAE90_16795 [Ignavibacteria bacterium]|nr:hypothetical protein [Ignavibacteria bacterium]